MLLPIAAFFVAGLFWRVWPWGVGAALAICILALFLRRQAFRNLWERSPRHAITAPFITLFTAQILCAGPMLLGNLLRFAVWGVPPF